MKRAEFQRWVAARKKQNKDRYERGRPGGGRLEREEPGPEDSQCQGTPPLWGDGVSLNRSRCAGSRGSGLRGGAPGVCEGLAHQHHRTDGWVEESRSKCARGGEAEPPMPSSKGCPAGFPSWELACSSF